jgi:hypothetical protein
MLSSELLRTAAARAEKLYLINEEAGSKIPSPLPDGEKHAPTASSFTIGAAFDDSMLAAIVSGAAAECGQWLKQGLGDCVLCDRDQSWVRRQYPPHRSPRWHAPHGWHQDGALGFPFASFPDGNYPADALLRMATCWIALDPCGAEAPGVELVSQHLPELLPPSELTDARVRQRFAAEHFWRPAMQAGDAILFRGDLLHRTHVTPAMTRDRTSIELRFFPAHDIPARLKGDRFLPLG